MIFEFLIPKRPVSLQTGKRANLQSWKAYVKSEAAKNWNNRMYSGAEIQLTLIYLCDENPVDTDNIIKPIQDALVGLIYDDDINITDVDSHRRPLIGTFDLSGLPTTLSKGILSGSECVYVRIRLARALEDYL